MTDLIEQTRLLAESHALKFEDLGGGHVQVSGHGVLVNYWPNSKARTVYNQTTGERVKRCQPWDAIKLCLGSAKSGIKPKSASKIQKKQKPQGSLEPVKSNPAGFQNFYDGEQPPWEKEGPLIMCQSDRLRAAAYRAESRAAALRHQADEMDGV